MSKRISEGEKIKRDIINELHGSRRVNFPRLKVIMKGIDETWSSDLCEFIPFANENNDMKFLLLVIDNFSKYAFAEPLPNKKSITVAEAFEKILKKSGRKPLKLQTDKGSMSLPLILLSFSYI